MCSVDFPCSSSLPSLSPFFFWVIAETFFLCFPVLSSQTFIFPHDNELSTFLSWVLQSADRERVPSLLLQPRRCRCYFAASLGVSLRLLATERQRRASRAANEVPNPLHGLLFVSGAPGPTRARPGRTKESV